ncbi:MAG: cell division protein ZapA [Bacteroidales bacterium]|nr:cell division protein ZapA [Bacteroidales bacterium]
MAYRANIKVAGRTFPLMAQDEAEEELYRRAAAVIDKTIEQRRTEFTNAQLEDLLIFIAFNECKVRIRCQREIEQINKELESLQAQLAGYLEKTEQ